VKVTRQGLLEVLTMAEQKAVVDAKRWTEAQAAWVERQKADWVRNKAPQWRALRDVITKALKAGTPITNDMVNSVLKSGRYSSSYWSDHTFSKKSPSQSEGLPHPDGTRVYPPKPLNEDLQAMKLFLEKYPEDTLTLEGLARAGFKAPSWVFRAAVGG
jgi:hypothetical protein